MKKVALVLLFVVILSACAIPEELATIRLGDPIPYAEVDYFRQFSILSVLKGSNQVAVVKVEDILSYGQDSIYTVTVQSVLAGQLTSETIKVLSPTHFYETST